MKPNSIIILLLCSLVSLVSGDRFSMATAQAEFSANSSPQDSELPISSLFGFKLYQGPFALKAESFNRASVKVYLPHQYEDQSDWPLVILLHGFSGTAEAEDTYLTLRHRTSSRGFILVTPEGTATPAGTLVEEKDVSGNQFWNATDFCCDFGKTGVDDVAYLRTMIEEVKAKFKVNGRKVYIIGHSNGGFMANRLACEIGEGIAAIANLGGGSFAESVDCRMPTAIPYLQIHAVDDPTISYAPTSLYAGGQDTIDQWVRRNDCRNPRVATELKDFLFLIPGDDTTETSWKDCGTGKEVVLWTIRAYETKGHNPHIPLFHLNFTDAVLDFLFRH